MNQIESCNGSKWELINDSFEFDGREFHGITDDTSGITYTFDEAIECDIIVEIK